MEQSVGIAEEMVLLALNEDGRVAYTAGTTQFRLAILGACFVDLTYSGHIEVDLEAVRLRDVVSPAPAAHSRILDALAAEPKAHRLNFWLHRLEPDAQDFVRDLLQSLMAQGILEREEGRLLWLIKTERYNLKDGGLQKEAKRRIADVLLGDDIPTGHDSVLMGLARQAGLLESFLSEAEIVRLRARGDAVGSLDLTARLVERAIIETQQAMAAAMMMQPLPC